LTWTGPIPGQFNAAFTEPELGQAFNHLVRKKKRYSKRPKRSRKGTSASSSDSSASSRLVSVATVTAATEAAAAAGAAAVTTSAPTDTTDTDANAATPLQRAAAITVVAAQAAAKGALASPAAPVPAISPVTVNTGYWPLTAVQSVTAVDMETVGRVLDTHAIRPSHFDSTLLANAVNADLKVWHSLDPEAHTGNRFYLFLTHIW
jgi:hypothetical protein